MDGKNFNEILLELRDGRVERELTSELEAVVLAVRDTGKTGTLSLKIKIEPDGGGDVYTLTPEITTRIPRPSLGGSIFYEKDGNLYRNNPNQADMFPANVTQINKKTGEIE